MPCGVSSAESQRDSAPKPRVASRELPWEKRVGSANPFSCAIWRHYNLCYYPTNGTTTDSDIWHVL